MSSLVDYFLLAFTSLFTMVNPLGTIPIFSSLTSGLSGKEARAVALKASVTAFFIMVLFAVGGKLIFDFFQISVNSLRVVGGAIFFVMGYEMLNARLTRMKQADETVTDFGNDIAITPLAIPMICGPGAITVVILLFQDAPQIEHKLTLVAVMAAVCALTWLFFSTGRKILGFLGERGSKVMIRLMGLIVMVIAVEFFFAGLTPLVRSMLKIQ
jgi:multiple antibiotic resistance protein